MARSIDHIVVVVDDLAGAIADYERAGFTVTPGGTHAGGATHNALIPFADGTYFELVAFTNPQRPQEHRWWPRLQRGEGLVDFALASDGLAAEADALRRHGIDIGAPTDGGRIRTDGQRVSWRTLGLGQALGRPALPFLIEDATPRALRVPGGPAARHALAVDRVAGLSIVVSDLDGASETFDQLLGQQERTRSAAGAPGGRVVRYELGRQWLELNQPDDPSSDAGRQLQARGEGPYEVVLSSGGSTASDGTLLPLDATHGARIRIPKSS